MPRVPDLIRRSAGQTVLAPMGGAVGNAHGMAQAAKATGSAGAPDRLPKGWAMW
jgi:hypothetical protein